MSRLFEGRGSHEDDDLANSMGTYDRERKQAEIYREMELSGELGPIIRTHDFLLDLLPVGSPRTQERYTCLRCGEVFAEDPGTTHHCGGKR